MTTSQFDELPATARTASRLSESTSASQEAYRFMRDRILTGFYAGGSRLDPTTIANELGMSRIPVREALRLLESDELITMKLNRTPRVTVLGADDFADLYEIRAAMEGQAIRHLASRMDTDAWRELNAMIDAMDRARHDPKLWMRRHSEFHQGICDRAGRPRLAREIARIRQATEPYVLQRVHEGHELELRGQEHSKLLNALVLGGDVAERTMIEHIHAAKNAFIARWTSSPPISPAKPNLDHSVPK